VRVPLHVADAPDRLHLGAAGAVLVEVAVLALLQQVLAATVTGELVAHPAEGGERERRERERERESERERERERRELTLFWEGSWRNDKAEGDGDGLYSREEKERSRRREERSRGLKEGRKGHEDERKGGKITRTGGREERSRG